MKKLQLARGLMALLLVMLLALAPVSVFAAPEADVATVAAVAEPTVAELTQDQNRTVTRGEFAMMLNTFLALPKGDGPGFDDVPENHPYAADILTAQAIGYMKGDGKGIFRPDAIISGAEAAICINFFLGFDLAKVPLNDRTTVPSWAKPAVSNLLDLNMCTLDLTDKKALTIADVSSYLGALTTAAMFPGSPYELKQVSEKDDFYGYNNRQYLATATIAPGYVYAMAFSEPDFNVQNQIGALLADILSSSGEPNSDAWKINEIFKMYMDEPGRAKSIETILPVINEIKAVKSIAELNALVAKYHSTLGILSFYGVSADSDAKVDATKWCAIIAPGTSMLSSRDYYADDPSLEPIHDALKKYIASILEYVGETDNLESRAAAVFAIDKSNALAAMPAEVINDPDVIYTKSSWAELDKIATKSNTLNYSPEIREALKDANVYCPDIDFVKHVETLYTEANLAALKDFAILSTVSTFGGVIGDDFSDLGTDLQIALFGSAPEKMSIELRAQTLIMNIMSGALSKLYADKYVTAATRNDVTQIVELIRGKYRDRINALDWMSSETKQKAVEKLDAIKAYVAYPDTYGTVYEFNVKAKADGGNLVDFIIDNSTAIYKQQLEKLKKPYELVLWDNVPTYTVNAFYTPTENAIIIPAGILQEPFYSKDAKREANLGAIGAVIAHEFSHAFDNSGAKYDKNGTITNWWTDADYAAFTALTTKVAASLSDIVFVGEQKVNGALCTGETIADLGGLSCALDIADDMDGADMALAMRSWAYIWAARMSPEVAAYILALDVHAPNKVRTNFVLSQISVFYNTFGITEGNGMYVAPEDRVTIW